MIRGQKYGDNHRDRCELERRGNLLSTGTVEASVLTADPAGVFERSPQGLTGSVQANREIVPRYLEFFRNLFRRFATKIDALDEVRVVSSKARNEIVKAGTCGSLHLIQRWFLEDAGNGRFLQECLIAASLSSLCTIMIGYRMTKDAVEPGKYTFLIVQGVSGGDCSGEALLKNIVHEGFFADPTTNKLPQSRFILQKALNNALCLSLHHHQSSPITFSYPLQEYFG